MLKNETAWYLTPPATPKGKRDASKFLKIATRVREKETAPQVGGSAGDNSSGLSLPVPGKAWRPQIKGVSQTD